MTDFYGTPMGQASIALRNARLRAEREGYEMASNGCTRDQARKGYGGGWRVSGWDNFHKDVQKAQEAQEQAKIREKLNRENQERLRGQSEVRRFDNSSGVMGVYRSPTASNAYRDGVNSEIRRIYEERQVRSEEDGRRRAQEQIERGDLVHEEQSSFHYTFEFAGDPNPRSFVLGLQRQWSNHYSSQIAKLERFFNESDAVSADDYNDLRKLYQTYLNFASLIAKEVSDTSRIIYNWSEFVDWSFYKGANKPYPGSKNPIKFDRPEILISVERANDLLRNVVDPFFIKKRDRQLARLFYGTIASVAVFVFGSILARPLVTADVPSCNIHQIDDAQFLGEQIAEAKGDFDTLKSNIPRAVYSEASYCSQSEIDKKAKYFSDYIDRNKSQIEITLARTFEMTSGKGD